MIMQIDTLRRLIGENKIDLALHILKTEMPAYPDLQNQLLAISSKFNSIRQKENIGLLVDSELFKFHSQVSFSLLELIDEIEKTNGYPATLPAQVAVEQGATLTPKKTVFLSYNHHDAGMANTLKDKLSEQGIDVVIDSERMEAGEDIQAFIEKCVKETGTTISLISKNSLLSAWVAMESINTFHREKAIGTKKFIACYVTDDFFRRTFTDEALDHIEGEIKEIQGLITMRMEKNRSIRDLQNELTRMTELRNNMDEIIRRLRESLCVDIRDGNLAKNFPKILQAIPT